MGLAGTLGRLLLLSIFSSVAHAQTAKPGWQTDWEKTIELAKKEGKVVVSIPASTELRAEIEKNFEKRYGIDVEPVVGRASNVVRKIVDEAKAGVRYVDLHTGGSESIVTALLPEGAEILLKFFWKTGATTYCKCAGERLTRYSAEGGTVPASAYFKTCPPFTYTPTILPGKGSWNAPGGPLRQ
jgi:hypothetical protein